MGDAENVLPPSKKRAAGREISRDNPGLDDDDDAPEEESGTFKKASEEVLAARRIVKVRRQPTPAAASSNPFAGICLVPPAFVSSAKSSEVTSETKPASEKPTAEEEVVRGAEKGVAESETNGKDKQSENTTDGQGVESSVNEVVKVPEKEADNPVSTDDKEADNPVSTDGKEANNPNSTDAKVASNPGGTDEKETEKEDEVNNGHTDTDPSGATASFSSFQQLSSGQNAFTGISGTGFSASSFSFGSIPKDGSAVGSGSGSLFGLKNDKPPTFPSFNFANSSNGSSLFGSTGASDVTKSEGGGAPSMQEVPVETGEENERAVFTADAVLFEYLDGGWKERGKGELKVNVSTTVNERARLVMRARGNYRLILNASLFADMKLANMEKRGVTFACMNSTGDGKDGLSTFALKFKDGSIVEEFRAAVTAHKGKKATSLKTPENSPKASDD